MGLDLSCGVSFSYGSFHSFRKLLASEIGIDLLKMEGFGGSDSFKDVKDDIKYLLRHSDCEGQMSAKVCGKVAPRLKELTKNWINSENKEINDYYYRKALELTKGMEECFTEDIPLYFQ